MNPTVTRGGLKTSEFIGFAGLFILILANGSDFFTIEESMITLYAGVATAYGAGRTVLKTSIAKKAEE